MTHAVVIQVRIDSESDIEHRHAILNDFVIPEAKALPGFQKGTWMNDGVGTGTCVVVFDTEDNAKSAVNPLTPSAGPALINSRGLAPRRPFCTRRKRARFDIPDRGGR